jgi:hypothetical protein
MMQPEQEGNPNAPMDMSAASAPVTSLDRPPYFDEALCDAEHLLKYAAEIGVTVDDDVRHAVLRARTHGTADGSEETTARLLEALTSLSALLAPVTAESLKVCIGQQGQAVLDYWKWASGLALALLCHLRSGAFLRKLSSMPNSRRLWMTYSSPMISRTHPRTTGRVGRGSSEPSPRSICRKVNATAVRTT